MAKLSYLQAFNAALHEEMDRDERVFVLGEDVAYNLMGLTGGLVERFGLERVRDTPISEAGFLGAAAGAAMVGMRPVLDMGIASFLYPAFDQLVSIVAKSTYVYGGQTNLPMVIFASMFYRMGTAAQHSDRPISTLMTIPGLKIIAPASPRDMKGLMKSAIRDDDPVVCLGAGACWGTNEEVPDDELVPLGVAAVKAEGTDVTVVGVSGAVLAAVDARDRLAERGVSVEVIDPRTYAPLDTATIVESVRKTGRLVVADITHDVCSVASHIAAVVAAEAFDALRGPIVRITTPQVHIPFSPPLEAPLYADADKIEHAVLQLVGERV